MRSLQALRRPSPVQLRMLLGPNTAFVDQQLQLQLSAGWRWWCIVMQKKMRNTRCDVFSPVRYHIGFTCRSTRRRCGIENVGTGGSSLIRVHAEFASSLRPFVRLDALALSVIATATWLAGWVAGWLSVTAGIVSKRLNVSENFFDHLIAPS